MLFFLLAFVIQDLPVCETTNTELGLITCRHCELQLSESVSFPGLDVQIFKYDRRRFIHAVSDAKPSYFYDRRETRHVIITNGRTGTYWKTDVVFFSGESGLAVYDNQDRVCGIVLGNVRNGNVWLGRVARFDALLLSIDLSRPEFRDRLDLLLPQRLDVRSTPEPQENVPSFRPTTSQPPTKEPQEIRGTFSLSR